MESTTQTSPMKTKFKSTIRAACRSFGGAVCAGAVLLIAAGAPAQNLFVGNFGNILEITPSGAQSNFASGLGSPYGLAFNSAGNLFEADYGSGKIYEFTPGGAQSTFASGLGLPWGLAFNSAGNLFAANRSGGYIYEFTTGGVKSTFASGLSGPGFLAFNSAGNLFDSAGNIYDFTPGGAESTFATGLGDAAGLAFEETIPEPSPWAMVAMGIGAVLGGLRLRRRSS
jgi:hypothetical protein